MKPQAEKTKFETLKELWKNPKTHNIIVLIFWFIFIGGVILFFKISSAFSTNDSTNQTTETVDPLENYNEMTSYEFTYIANNLSLNGISYEDKYLLYLDNQKYYKSDSLYKIGENIEISEEPEILKLNNTMIYNLIKDITAITNAEYDSYLVPLISFINTYEGITVEDYSLTAYNIIINVYTEDEVVNKITVDLTSYYNYKEINIDSYILTINYYNINNISDFTQEYDEMIGVK